MPGQGQHIYLKSVERLYKLIKSSVAWQGFYFKNQLGHSTELLALRDGITGGYRQTA